MTLPDPRRAVWTERHFDFGWQYALSFEWGSLRHATRCIVGGHRNLPHPEMLAMMREILLQWFWRKLGAA